MPTRGSACCEPSSARSARMAAAARRPSSMPARLCASVRDLAEVLGEQLVEARSLRREHRDQRVVRRLRDRGVHRGAGAARREAGVALVAAVDRVHRIEHRDVDDRHRAARPAGPELLAEDPVLAGRTGVWSSPLALIAIWFQ